MKIFAGMAVVAGIPIAALYVDARISSNPSIWPVVIAALLLFIAGVSMSAGLRWPIRTLRISWFCACPVMVLVQLYKEGLPPEPSALGMELTLLFVTMIPFVIVLTGIPWFFGLDIGARWSGHEPFQRVRQHSPFLAYVLLWLTAGLYWFYWLYRMMRDLNAMHHRPMFDVKRIALLASGYLFLYSVSFFTFFIAIDLAPEPSGLWQGMMALGLFLMALGWFVGWFICMSELVALSSLCRYARRFKDVYRPAQPVCFSLSTLEWFRISSLT